MPETKTPTAAANTATLKRETREALSSANVTADVHAGRRWIRITPRGESTVADVLAAIPAGYVLDSSPGYVYVDRVEWTGPVSIVEAPAGSTIRYTYDDPDLGVVTVEGVKAHAVGMSELGNQGFRVETADGVRYCSRYATVEIAR